MSHANYSRHGRLLGITPINRDPAFRRRSRRVALNVPVTLSGQDRQKCSFTILARATNLNKHGAAIQLNQELLVGSAINVQNTRGIHTSARVVAQVSAVHGVLTYGIEFLEDGGVRDFWGIAFPHPPQERKTIGA